MAVKHRGYDRKSFIILPIAFLILGFLLMYFIVKPIVAPLMEYADLILWESEMDYDKDFNDIFVPSVPIEKDDENISQPVEQPETVPLSSIEYPTYGTKYAQIRIPECNVDTYLYFGDSNAILAKGAGQYIGSFIPGYGKVIIACAHNNTYFNGFKNMELGYEIYVDTSYGRYVYTVTETKIITTSQKEELRLDSEEEVLILYTCYPFDELGLTNKRFLVVAEYTSGPVIDHKS